jgi:hypothetical protein
MTHYDGCCYLSGHLRARIRLIRMTRHYASHVSLYGSRRAPSAAPARVIALSGMSADASVNMDRRLLRLPPISQQGRWHQRQSRFYKRRWRRQSRPPLFCQSQPNEATSAVASAMATPPALDFLSILGRRIPHARTTRARFRCIWDLEIPTLVSWPLAVERTATVGHEIDCRN